MAVNSVLTEEVKSSLLEEKIIITIDNGNAQSIYEKAVDLNNPFSFDWEPFAPTSKPLTLSGFLDLTQEILSDQQDRDGINESKKVKLVAQYPIDNLHEFGDCVFTYRVISRNPANLGQKDDSYRQRSWKHSFEITSPKIPKHKLVVENRLLTHIIEISVWSKSARLANEKVLWLERTLIDHTYLYLIKGAEKFFWESRLADTYMNVSGQPLFQRPLRFYVNLNDFRIKAEPIISVINIGIEPTYPQTLSTLQYMISQKLYS